MRADRLHPCFVPRSVRPNDLLLNPRVAPFAIFDGTDSVQGFIAYATYPPKRAHTALPAPSAPLNFLSPSKAIGSLPPGGGATLRTLILLGGVLTPLAFSSTLYGGGLTPLAVSAIL